MPPLATTAKNLAILPVSERILFGSGEVSVLDGWMGMSESPSRFSCQSCKRTYTWKPELAGKRVKCKCGQAMTVPQQIQAAEPEADDLYALAEDAEKAAAAQPARIIAAPTPAPAAAKTSARRAGGSAVPLAYQRGPTQREKEQAVTAMQLDVRRDIQAPLAFCILGLLLYISYYAIHYSMGVNGVIFAGIGLMIMNFFEALFLFVFALFISGPLGVSFGDIRTAFFKLAAVAVFCDGVTTWVDAMVSKYSGGFGSGFFGFGVIGFPVALGVYWGMMIYLFDMDPGDSWLVVVILAIFYRILRIVFVVLLLGLVLGFVGIARTAIPVPTGGSSGPTNPMVDEVNDAKDRGLLKEARQYIADGHQATWGDAVKSWYAAGCKNVWFELSRDINGRGSAYQLIVELPTGKTQRAKCYQILKDYYDSNKMRYDPEDVTDAGEPYLMIDVN